MEAKHVKVPLSGSVLLVVAGGLLLSVVSLVAARATVMDFLADQGIQATSREPAPPAVAPERTVAPEAAPAVPEPVAPEPVALQPAPPVAPEPAPTAPATIQSIQQRLAQGSDEIWEQCFSQGLPADSGDGRWLIKVTIAEDGSVAAAEVTGPSPEGRSCIRAAVVRWQFGPLGKRMTVSKQLVYR